MFSLTVFLATVAITISAAQNTCNTQSTINRPVNGQPVYWPATWRENQTAPALAEDQSCSWIVTIPEGYYARLIINGKMGDPYSHFLTIDSAGNLITSSHETMQPYFFPPSKFTLSLSNDEVAAFAFKIEWSPFNIPTSYDAGIGMQPHVLNITKDRFAAEFNSDAVSLLVSPVDPKNYYSLRSTLVFEGQDFNGFYRTNLYLLYRSRQQWISSKQTIYVINLEASNKLDTLLIQDAQYTRDYADYVQLNCGGSTTCIATVDGGNKKSAIASVLVSQNNETLVDIRMDPSATMKVYYGSETAFAFDSTYNGSTINSLLPLTFYGSYVTQYVISNGKATLTFNIPQ
ncbi:CUB-like domain-containing protein [Caenorhabditis elegans]|uniref:CUB-like domain-containing protein n=1 Tax=Caenorhabditis elegans TaxID=6239 RepID=Q9XUH8_CAEEL|nr:CUB-like domain-containing protein [Caenorhabditis elegans]CAB05130.1 CUB-like domain-containing protein [Caenorhabditis elegans]|eukprot:NP_502465.1 Uncharacterized protein CELE_C32H11.3 [Caenorhabditis elegans]